MTFKRFLKLTAAFTACIMTAGLFAGCTATASEIPPYANARDVTELGVKADTDLSEFFTNLNAAEKDDLVLWFPAGNYVFKKSVSVNQRFSIVLAEGAKITVEAEAAVGFASVVFSAPAKQVFYGEGTVKYFGSAVRVRTEWFGAFPNDNKDDTEGIQKALYAAGGRLWLEKGTYNVNSSVSIENSASGVGAAGVAIRGAKDGGTVIKVARDVVAFKDSEGSSAGSYYFEDLAFEGSGSGEGIVTYQRIYIANCSFKNLDRGLYNKCGGMCSFLYCTGENVKGNVLEVGEDTMFIYFFGDRAKNCGTLIKVHGSGALTTGIQITDCHTENMTGYDLELGGIGGDTNYVDACTFKGGTGKAFIHMASIGYPHVADCIFEGNGQKDGVVFESCIYAVSVMDNLFKNVGTAVSMLACKAAAVSYNAFEGNKRDICLTNSSSISVHDNYFGSDEPLEFVGIDNCVTVTSNRFKKAEFDVASLFADPVLAGVGDNLFSVSEKAEKSLDGTYKNRTIEPAVTAAVESGVVSTAKGSVKVRDFGTGAAAVEEAFNSGASTVIFDGGEFNIERDVTVTENVSVAVSTDSLIKVASGATLTVLNENVTCLPAKRIFEGSVRLPAASYVLTEWFGAKTNDSEDDSAALALAAATGAGSVRLLRGTYDVENGVKVGKGGAAGFIGEGHDHTVVKSATDEAVFEINNVGEGVRFKVAAMTANGNNYGNFINYTGPETSSLYVCDIFGGTFKNFVCGENAYNIDIADLYLGTLDGGVTMRGSNNVTGLRSLLMPAAGYFIDIDGATEGGKKGGGYYFHNFCSVYCLKDLVVKNADGFYFSAGGFDSAYGNRDVTLDFENCENVRFETTFLTTEHDKMLLCENCKNLVFIGLPFNGIKNRAVVFKDSENVSLMDSWFYHVNGDIICAENTKDVKIVGNSFDETTAKEKHPIATASGSSGIFYANVCHSDYAFAEIEGLVSRYNKSDYNNVPDIEVEIDAAAKGFLVLPSGGQSAGYSYMEGNDFILKVATGSWFADTGVVSKEKIKLDGLETVAEIIRDSYKETGKDRNFSIILTNEKPTKLVAKGLGQTNVDDSAILCFYFTDDGIKLASRNSGDFRSVGKISSEAIVSSESVPETSGEMKIKFTVSGSDVIITVNGKSIKAEGLAGKLGSEVYLTYFIHGYGAAGITARIASLNGSSLK